MEVHEALRALRIALCDLFDNPASVKVLMDDAGIDATRVNYSGRIDNVWHNVLAEARRVNKIETMVQLALEQYKGNAKLTNAYQAYLAIQAPSPPTPSDPQKIDPALQQNNRVIAAEQADEPYDVFISYSHVNTQWVWESLLPRLENAGLRVCIDKRDFAIGVPSQEEQRSF